jgi:predicted nucleic acid-binding protein
MRFVVDNSIVMAWCFEDESGGLAENILDSLRNNEAIVPAIWPLEVGNVLLVAERKGRIDRADVVWFLELLRNLPIAVDQESPERMLTSILALARECRISTYDASYLDLAMRSGVPLATQDRTLEKAAKKCRVTILTKRNIRKFLEPHS